ncbi:MAG: hypothetical protein JXC36_07735 [Candidatus Atribacteria bacterium]|nr:hypothetical protein [Candidatus Atribacteria bacterium]
MAEANILNELKIAEFKALRAEIEATSKRTYDTVFLALTGSSALIGYGFTKENPWIFLTPLIIIWGASQIIRQSYRSQRRLVAYIRVFHETDEMWESVLAQSRILVKKERCERGNSNITQRLRLVAQYELLWLLGAISIAAGWLGINFSSCIDMIVISIISLVWLYMYVYLKKQSKHLEGNGIVEQEFIRQFNSVKNELKNQSG